MALKSILKPEGGVFAGLAEAAAVYVIYQSALPTHAEIRMSDQHNNDIEMSRRGAAWHSAAILGVVFLVTKDLNAFIIGGLALTAIDLHFKHSNMVNPAIGKAFAAAPAGDNANPYPMTSAS